MAPPLDLTGRRIGALTVLRRDGRIVWGKDQAAWLCLCDCGTELRVPQNRLPHRESIPASHRIEACDACRAKPCEICGSPVSASSASKTCSPACHAERSRRYQLAYWRANRRNDPAVRAAHAGRRKASWAALDAEGRREAYRAKVAAEGRERINERARARYAERKKDPAFVERSRERRAAWRAAHPDEARRFSRDHRRRQRAVRYARELGQAAEALESIKEIENDDGDR
jgi:hypothetical protein